MQPQRQCWAPHQYVLRQISNPIPIWTTAYITRNHGYLVYNMLFGTDENQQIQPQMVERTRISPDGMRYVFTLRDGLRWHDGKPVRSEDGVASLNKECRLCPPT